MATAGATSNDKIDSMPSGSNQIGHTKQNESWFENMF